MPEQCPVFFGEWGTEGTCGLTGEKVVAGDEACSPLDQQDFTDLHVKVNIKDPPVVLNTEGKERTEIKPGTKLREREISSCCPLVNPGTCDVCRNERLGITSAIVFPITATT